MSNLRIINTNIVDANTLAASTTTSGFPASNLKLEQKSATWRSVGTSGTLTSTFTSSTVNGVALAFANLTSSATITVELYLSAGLQLTTGALSVGFIYGPPAGFTTNSSSSFGFGGGNYYSTFFADTTADEVRVIIADATNPDGLIEVSRLIIGNGFLPVCNASYGASVTPTDNTEISETDSGDLTVSRGVASKILSFKIDKMVAADRQSVNEIINTNGKHTPVFISLLPEVGGETEKSHQIYGYFLKDNPIVASSYNRYNSTLEVKQI